MIAGLIPCSFIDYPSHLAAVVFLQGCNLHCPYCHNAQLIPRRGSTSTPPGELLAWLRTRQGKLGGVVVTGGEPTLHSDLESLIVSIRALGFRIKLDTNGTHPEVLGQLLDRGVLDYVAMDLKDLPERYGDWLGPRHVGDRVERSIRLLRSSSIPHEFRTTLVPNRHDLPTLDALRALTAGAPWYLQQTVETGNRTSMPNGSRILQGLSGGKCGAEQADGSRALTA